MPPGIAFVALNMLVNHTSHAVDAMPWSLAGASPRLLYRRWGDIEL
ncbi:MAG: hypothetical protein KDI74_04550 [Gammaproteobacteria bacterium]|nr:hypothetical protein [Gammaproteobacteria bacterium]